ncbi:hypothetical protein GIB67_028334 [Kingdonia uniflora]|uniref:Uncharacterized protein n=1 Tax=Kingdonia uniflora TaxID=39325 RepID=A0A7J7MI06_9MAGN|nr:hypothetical protein GIB67_028334 [Kingdonia uniflora]
MTDKSNLQMTRRNKPMTKLNFIMTKSLPWPLTQVFTASQSQTAPKLIPPIWD